MDKNEPNNNGNNKPANSYVKFTGLGFQMIAIIGGVTFAGYKIDQAAHHSTQWVTAVMALTGVFISLYLVIRSVRN